MVLDHSFFWDWCFWVLWKTRLLIMRIWRRGWDRGVHRRGGWLGIDFFWFRSFECYPFWITSLLVFGFCLIAVLAFLIVVLSFFSSLLELLFFVLSLFWRLILLLLLSICLRSSCRSGRRLRTSPEMCHLFLSIFLSGRNESNLRELSLDGVWTRLGSGCGGSVFLVWTARWIGCWFGSFWGWGSVFDRGGVWFFMLELCRACGWIWWVWWIPMMRSWWECSLP